MKTRLVTFQSKTLGTEQPMRQLSFLSPGLFLLLLAGILILAPKLLLTVISVLLLFFGGLLLFLGYKFLSFKRKLDQEVAKMEQMAKGGFSEPNATGGFSGNFNDFFSHTGSTGQSSSADGTTFEIDGESIEVMDAEDLDHSEEELSDKKEKIIIH